MSSRRSVTLIFLAFFALSFSVQRGACQEESSQDDMGNLANYLVFFEPPISVGDEEDRSECTGIIRSPDRIIMTSACAAAARHLRQEGAVSVLDIQGGNVGHLPAISGQPFEAIQSLLEPAQLVPFIGGQKTDRAFPVFVGDQRPAIDDTTTYHLLNPHSQVEDVVDPPVQLQKLPSENKFRLSGLNPVLLGHYPEGSPVVSDQGEVICLLADEGLCENASVKIVGDDDGSCHIPYFQCGNVTWSRCENEVGVGVCTNEKSNESCNVTVVPDMLDSRDGSLHCRNHDGCAILLCPIGCCTDEEHCNCGCTAFTGFCDAPTSEKTNTVPDKCIGQHGGEGGKDSRCYITAPPVTGPATKPDDFRHSPAFLGVVIGVPTGIVAIGVVAVVAMTAIACKYRPRTGYKAVQ